MAQIRIEMDRGMGWEVRQEGNVEITADKLTSFLPSYSIQHRHRALLDGVLIASTERPIRGRVNVVRHDV
jgi:hypothetical protein